jgi:hypothetical protein
MKCTRCRHLDARHGECIKLRGKVICGVCLKVYRLEDIRCPRCHLRSTNEAWKLGRTGGQYDSAAFCPLSKEQRDSLREIQGTPIKKQGELF